MVSPLSAASIAASSVAYSVSPIFASLPSSAKAGSIAENPVVRAIRIAKSMDKARLDCFIVFPLFFIYLPPPFGATVKVERKRLNTTYRIHG